MGGQTLSDSDTEALSAFLLKGLRPVQRRQTEAPPLVAQGERLFRDEEVGCAGCHPSERVFTDAKVHDVKFTTAQERQTFVSFSPENARMPGAFNTPSLTGIALSAPYMHNGEVASLEELIEVNADRMGSTSQLNAEERRALVAYLKSL